MLAISGITALFFVLLGVVFFCGKGSALIAGYNTASHEKKGMYDEKVLCHTMGGLMFVLAACVGVMALSSIFDNIVLLWIGLALFVAVAIGGAIYMNTSQKVKRK